MTIRRLLVPLFLAAMAGRAEAAFTMTFTQVGADVVVSGTGTLNIDGLGTGTRFLLASGIRPNNAFAVVGTLPIEEIRALAYTVSFSGSTTYGPGELRRPDAGSGDLVGFQVPMNRIFVPLNYISGATLTSSMTFANQTIASIGMTPGTFTTYYSATAGGAVLDSITIQVGAAPVPEPASLAMVGSALTGIGLAARRRSRS